MERTSNTAGTQQAKSATAIPLHIAMSLTNGGRSLNAIWYLKIPPVHKLILQFFGSEMNFTGSFEEPMQVTRKTIAAFVGISVDTLDRGIKSLVELGYLSKVAYEDEYNCQLASEYALTEKLFDSYAQFLTAHESERGMSPKVASFKRVMGNYMIDVEEKSGTNESNIKRRGSRKLRPGVAANCGPFTPPSSAPENSEPQSETKTENPCHSGGGLASPQASITPNEHVKKENSPPLVNGGHVVSFVKAMAFTYKVGRLGNYDWEIANEAAERFISEKGLVACSILKSWATSKSDFDRKCVKVGANMFERLWTAMEAENKD